MIAHAEVEALARSTGGTVVVVRTVALPPSVDPLAWFARARERFGDAVYLARPDRGSVLVGAGVSDESGTAAIVRDEATRAIAGPYRLGGFAFDPSDRPDRAWHEFPARRLVLPRVLLRLDNGAATATLAFAVRSGGDPDAAERAARADLDALIAAVRPAPRAAPRVLARSETPADWRAAVATTAAEIRAGALAKAVLARRVELRLDGDVDVIGTLDRLAAAHPAATIYAFARETSCFLGAAPERLVRLAGGRFETDAVAGTVARGADATQDDAYARALFASAKDRVEHDLVVRWLRDALVDVAQEIGAAPEPRVRALGNVQHLYTPLWGRTSNGVLDLVARLHPTPAVAGVPRAAALATIREREGFDRGWYAGPVGWVDAEGAGEFAVALRCALTGPRTATLFSGAGIVGDSHPDAEYDETQLKLRAIASALGLDA